MRNKPHQNARKRSLFAKYSSTQSKHQRYRIRLRNETGRKWAVKGSRQGLFIATQSGASTTLLIVEGPTDAAAAIDLGFRVIGRPACVGCEDMIAELVRKHGHVTTLIVADADAPGQRRAFDK